MAAERSFSRGQACRFSTAVALAAPILATGALLMALSIYLPRFYAGHVRLGLAAVGLAIMVVRLADIAIDPLIGLAIDKTRTRVGSYRPWIKAAVPMLLVSVFKLFGPPPQTRRPAISSDGYSSSISASR